MDHEHDTTVGAAWEKANDQRLKVRFWFEILAMAISLSIFFGIAFGVVRTVKGDFYNLFVPFGFLVFLCQKMFRDEEFPWRRQSSLIFGILLIIAMGLIVFRDLNFPSTPR
ncbi:MAG: hypothetical protein ACKVQS_08580 [Fimbriimonadaceae bacterium]